MIQTLTFQGQVFSAHTVRFTIKQIYFLPTECFYMFREGLRPRAINFICTINLLILIAKAKSLLRSTH
jgi:hypothetical protein